MPAPNGTFSVNQVPSPVCIQYMLKLSSILWIENGLLKEHLLRIFVVCESFRNEEAIFVIKPYLDTA
jgi:hypothetical protein